jgi:hypothetical protein
VIKESVMNRVLTRSLALAAVLAGAATSAGAAPSAHLNPASPPLYVGPCPGVIHFSGWISGGVGMVKYQWYRSDGATGPVETAVIGPRDRVGITDTWTLGGVPALPTYSGWEAVRILAPKGLPSNRATFTLRCLGNSQRAAPPPRK